MLDEVIFRVHLLLRRSDYVFLLIAQRLSVCECINKVDSKGHGSFDRLEFLDLEVVAKPGPFV